MKAHHAPALGFSGNLVGCALKGAHLGFVDWGNVFTPTILASERGPWTTLAFRPGITSTP